MLATCMRVLLIVTRESLLWGATAHARDLCNVSATCSVLYAAAQPVRPSLSCFPW